MAEINLDENVSLYLAPPLRWRGHDVIAPEQLGLRDAGDHRHLTMSARLNRILVTHNEKDFLLLHRAWQAWFGEWPPVPLPHHGGILIIPQPPRLSEDRAAKLLDQFIRGHDPHAGFADRIFVWRSVSGWRERT